MYILSYIQSQADYDNVMQHISVDGKVANKVKENEQNLYQTLILYSEYAVQKGLDIKSFIVKLQDRRAYPQRPYSQNKQVRPYPGVKGNE